jgi:hypothetical protein
MKVSKTTAANALNLDKELIRAQITMLHRHSKALEEFNKHQNLETWIPGVGWGYNGMGSRKKRQAREYNIIRWKYDENGQVRYLLQSIPKEFYKIERLAAKD